MFLNGITNGMSVAHLKKVKGNVVVCSSKKTIKNEKKHTLREGD